MKYTSVIKWKPVKRNDSTKKTLNYTNNKIIKNYRKMVYKKINNIVQEMSALLVSINLFKNNEKIIIKWFYFFYLIYTLFQ